MKRTTKSLIKSYAVVSVFIFLIGFLFPPMIFHSNPVDHPMLAIYSGLFTLIVSWVFMIAGCVVRYSITKPKPPSEAEIYHKKWEEKMKPYLESEEKYERGIKK